MASLLPPTFQCGSSLLTSPPNSGAGHHGTHPCLHTVSAPAFPCPGAVSGLTLGQQMIACCPWGLRGHLPEYKVYVPSTQRPPDLPPKMPIATQRVVRIMEVEGEWQEKSHLTQLKLKYLILQILQKPVISGHILGGLQAASIHYPALRRPGSARSKWLPMAAGEGRLRAQPTSHGRGFLRPLV
ncbi:hypothetical protein HJG60_009211 [Phyllostomus discolor]|uniref:Uncharacterized protein n=1 Tax=Phyllostomus discolor TaxID=89673 RepID=A0A834DHD2_9CHIR|nr:hypothetical protein HJG60_009211 [Phyllostomus discolor]